MPSIFKTALVAAFAAVASAQVSNYTAPTAAVVPGWKYNGCVSSSNAGVDFSFPGFTLIQTSSTSMTIELCTSTCNAYQFAAVTSGSCYCGNSNNGTLAVAETNCRNRCPGKMTEACGGTAGTLPVKRQITGFPYYSLYERIAAVPAGTVYTTVVVNIYIAVCPTGFTTITALSTATLTGCGCATATVPVIPVTTTVVQCTACPTAGLVTLTVPVGAPATTVVAATPATVTVVAAATTAVVVATPAGGAGAAGAGTTTAARPATFTGAASANKVGAGILAIAGAVALL